LSGNKAVVGIKFSTNYRTCRFTLHELASHYGDIGNHAEQNHGSHE
jgi:hypothetical protein